MGPVTTAIINVMDYTNYTVEDLAADDSFIQWANRSNAVAEKFWDDFAAAHPEMNVKIAQARTLVLNLRKAEGSRHSPQQLDSIWAGIELRMEADAERTSPDLKNKHFRPSAWAALAGMLFICVGTWYVLNPRQQGTGNDVNFDALLSDEAYIEEVNTSGEILRVHLSDGSTVSLEQKSRLKYRKSFSEEPIRSVYLTGEAFFEVAKDPRKPFMVHANEVVTRVLGTSFRVKAPDNEEEVVVSVKTGKVSVYAVDPKNTDETRHKNAVVVLPNQQVTYLRTQDTFGKALVAEPEIILPSVSDTDFTFENTPIKTVFSVLEKAYGIDIIFDEEVMSNCFITAPLGKEPLFEKLRVICRTIGARYETMDAKVVITSTGC